MECKDKKHVYVKISQLIDQRNEIKDNKKYLVNIYWNQCSFCDYEDNWEEWNEIEDLGNYWRYKQESEPIIVQL